MPEGPEIRRAADKIASVLVGKTIETVEFGLPWLKHHEEMLSGSAVVRIETRGKANQQHFSNGNKISFNMVFR